MKLEKDSTKSPCKIYTGGELQNKQSLTALGWGQSESENFVPMLQKVDSLLFEPLSECNAQDKWLGYLKPGLMCADGPNGEDTCDGRKSMKIPSPSYEHSLSCNLVLRISAIGKKVQANCWLVQSLPVTYVIRIQSIQVKSFLNIIGWWLRASIALSLVNQWLIMPILLVNQVLGNWACAQDFQNNLNTVEFFE